MQDPKDYYVILYRKCSFCCGTGRHLEGKRFDENGNLEYYEDDLGECPQCGGKGSFPERVTLEEVFSMFRKN
jgi:hypothetical protein